MTDTGKKFDHISSHSDLFSNDDGKLKKDAKVGETTSISITCSLKDSAKGIKNVLKVLKKDRIVNIEARGSKTVGCEIDVLAEVDITHSGKDAIEEELNEDENISDVMIIENDQNGSDLGYPWFPRNLTDLDKCGVNVLMYGSELDADHPGFKDAEYRKRRRLFTEIALKFKHGNEIPRIEYTPEEIEIWGKVYRQLMSLYPTTACSEHIRNFPLLALHCGFTEDNIPQLEDISRFLSNRTGFRLRPCAGFLSPRDFLASLAFRVFNCTQYIRHSSDPFYTPEPDICHELFGHVPLLADEEFAQFSQEVGLASLGASDDDISKLAACYLYTIEFGLCCEDGNVKAYGAGLLSSIAELKHALTSPDKIRTFEPETASQQEFYVTTFQPVYFLSQSFHEAKDKMRNYVQTIKRPFTIRYNAFTNSVRVMDNLEDINTVINNLDEEINKLKTAKQKLKNLHP